jgi:hypothetical protein
LGEGLGWPQRGAKGAKNHASLSAAKPQPNRHRILQEATEATKAMTADMNRFLNSEFCTEDNEENEGHDVRRKLDFVTFVPFCKNPK